MKTFIDRELVKANYNVTDEQLDRLIPIFEPKEDIAEFVLSNGEIEIRFSADALQQYVTERDVTPDKFKHLQGNLLGITEAAEKYNLNQVTVSGWVKQGKLEVQKKEGRKKLIDEADIAYMAAMAQGKNMSPGKKIFSF